MAHLAMLFVLHTATPSALGAEVTDMPPGLRGDIHLRYDGRYQRGDLVEERAPGEAIELDPTMVRKLSEHVLTTRIEFAPVDGVAFTVGLPATLDLRYTFKDGREMLFEPSEGSGSYEYGGVLADQPSYKGSGLQGVWIGGAFAPLAERYRRDLGVTWRIDAGFRTPNRKHVLWNGGDKRGAAPGGWALGLGAAFSRDKGRANPYLDLDMVLELPTKVDVVDADGQTQATDLTVRAASKVDVTAGVELVSTEDREIGNRFAVDLFAGFGYRSWEDMPSGFLLPSVLEGSKEIAVTQSDHVLVRMGMGFDYHVNRWIGLRLGAEGRYYTPHQIENVYPVYTGPNTFEVAWNLALVGRVRLKDDPPVGTTRRTRQEEAF